MNEASRVAAPPAKPLLVYDGDCRFCTLWIKRWQQTTGDRVDYVPFQDASVAERFPEIPRGQFETAVQLIETDGRVYTAAQAALRALAKNPARQWLLRCYEKLPFFARVADRCYRFVAEHRPFFSTLTRLAYGKHVELPSHFLVRWVFLRALGMIYLIAFVSLWTQVDGLVGSKGILPTNQFMESVRRQVDQQKIGADRYRLLPTLCWFSGSDASLHFQCAAGTVLAVLVIIGIAPAPCLFLLWLIYLSLSTVCRDFLSFQWDILLLETGFLAIFLAPLQLWPRLSREAPPSRLVLWLLRWLLFRLTFESGCVKLLSGDLLWRNLTALTVHYETQPLPTWIGWYAHQLPLWLQKTSCLVMFIVELAIPFLFFAPRRLRIFGGAIAALFQVVILLTGNYTFFNWLTLALCLLLLDDFALAKFLPVRSRRRKVAEGSQFDSVRLLTSTATKPCRRWARAVTVPLAVVVIAVTSLQLAAMFGIRSPLFAPVVAVYQWCAPFRSLNNYGLFAVMTPSRPEIIIEGSNDGINWLPYEFKYKPGDVKRRPRFVAPHQPRLDWQLWFEALHAERGGRPSLWFASTCIHLLQGAPKVVALLEQNPFPQKPPRYVRATLYDYRFTDFAERKRTGAWWRRKPIGEYLPPISRRESAAPTANRTQLRG